MYVFLYLYKYCFVNFTWLSYFSVTVIHKFTYLYKYFHLRYFHCQKSTSEKHITFIESV